jgi:hypothetical protein
MVSVGEPAPRAGLGSNATAHSPLFATSTLLAKDLFPIEVWCPRSGRDQQYPKWEAGVRRLLYAFGVDEAELRSGMERVAHLLQGANGISGGASATRLSAKEAAALDEECASWQRVNTALFWHVLPSLNVDTEHHLRDTRKIDTLYERKLADGLGPWRNYLKRTLAMRGH